MTTPPTPKLPVAIQRLIDEIKVQDTTPTRYNRVYSRHNRS